MDATKVESVGVPQRPNERSYLSLQNAQLFRQGMSFSGNERDKVWINRGGGGFADLSDVSGADSPNDGRAAIAADFDDDGDVDLFVHHIQRERHSLLRNGAVEAGSASARYLKVRLRATKSQHEAIGAIVMAKSPLGPVAQVLSRGAGFVSCQPPELVFGIGAAESAEVEVIWPGARRESFGAIAANSRVLLVEGSGKPEPFATRPRALPDPLPAGLKLAEGDLVPEIALVDGAGRAVQLDVRALADGKPLFLNFWASWCPPCVAELPALAKLAAKGDVRAAAIGLDLPADRAKASALLRERGGELAAYFLPEKAKEGTRGIDAIVDLERLPIPTTLVLSPEGRVESILRGPVAESR